MVESELCIEVDYIGAASPLRKISLAIRKNSEDPPMFTKQIKIDEGELLAIRVIADSEGHVESEISYSNPPKKSISPEVL